MHSFEEARRIVATEEIARDIESRRTEDAVGRVLVEDQRAAEDSPRFRQAAMDGYAVRASDTQTADSSTSVDLTIVGRIPAGASSSRAIGRGEAARIYTGAPIPEGADAVVMQEHVETEDGRLRLIEPVERCENIRHRGEEYEAGADLLSSGSVLTPESLGVLLDEGITDVAVYERPRVGILTTGDELVDPEDDPGPGEIRDSLRGSLRAAVEGMARSVELRRVEDEVPRVTEVLEELLDENDLVLTTGGVSVGDRDLVRPALADCGVRTLLWKVRQKPGKPVYAGRTEDTIVLGLPGNPVSSLVCFYLYGFPLLRRMGGHSVETAFLSEAQTVLEKEVVGRAGRSEFFRARTRWEGERYVSRPMERQGSHMLSGLSEADSLVRLPEDWSEAVPGDVLPVYFLPRS